MHHHIFALNIWIVFICDFGYTPMPLLCVYIFHISKYHTINTEKYFIKIIFMRAINLLFRFYSIQLSVQILLLLHAWSSFVKLCHNAIEKKLWIRIYSHELIIMNSMQNRTVSERVQYTYIYMYIHWQNRRWPILCNGKWSRNNSEQFSFLNAV